MTYHKFLITLYAAITMALFSSPLGAQTDRYFFSESGDWQVNVEISTDLEMACSAVTRNSLGETFDVTVWESSKISFHFWFNNQDEQVLNQPMDVLIPGVHGWRLDPMLMTINGGVHTFDHPSIGLEFVTDLQQGTAAFVTKPTPIEGSGAFSLAGSKAALDDLFRCFNMINGGAA